MTIANYNIVIDYEFIFYRLFLLRPKSWWACVTWLAVDLSQQEQFPVCFVSATLCTVLLYCIRIYIVLHYISVLIVQKPFPVCFVFLLGNTIIPWLFCQRSHLHSFIVLHCRTLYFMILSTFNFDPHFHKRDSLSFLSVLCSALFYCATFALKLCTVPHCISCIGLCTLYTLVCKLCVSVHCVL